MSTVVTPVTIDRTLDEEKRPVHLLCCDEEGNEVLCGSPTTQELPGHYEADCVVCIDLEESGYCPKYGKCL